MHDKNVKVQALDKICNVWLVEVHYYYCKVVLCKVNICLEGRDIYGLLPRIDVWIGGIEVIFLL